MSLSARIFIVYMLFVSVCGYFVLHTVMEEIKPGVRQSTEETLVDTANLLAEFLREPLLQHQLQSPNIQNILAAYGQRDPGARIWGVQKNGVSHRIYVTDKNGIVLLDSQGLAVGQDYSRWNDVYLTLQGKYGARSSTEIQGDKNSTVMYVGAPIKNGRDIIGVVSVAKPNRALQPYIERTQKRLALMGGGLILLGLISGALFSWWLSRELRRLRQYAGDLTQGKKVAMPHSLIHSGELHQLALALSSMRAQLDGKAYVERYVQTLAHELKSPLTGIHAAAELLQSPMAPEQQQKFVGNIFSESLRLQQLIERLLKLSQLEQQQVLEKRQPLLLNKLVDELVASAGARLEKGQVQLVQEADGEVQLEGDEFLLKQAVANLLDNALDFTPAQGHIHVYIRSSERCLVMVNEGTAIPDFALPRLTERFYSLPRPATGKKSTGLGLAFVQEVMHLHQGRLEIQNTEQGVSVSLQFSS